MKLIKINTDHYVVVDDLEIINGDWYYDSNDVESLIPIYQKSQQFADYSGCKKITHSTQPIEEGTTIHGIEHKKWNHVKFIDLSEVKELIGEVDVEKKAEEKYTKKDFAPGEILIRKIAWMNGYNQALEDNKNKKYTEEDLRRAFFNGGNMKEIEEFNSFIQSFQTKTEWEVEMVDGKLKLKC